MRKITFLLFFLFLLSDSQKSWAVNEAGLPGEFLNFGVGARAMGMARAFTAVADDVDSIYYNPAGLSTYRSSQLAFFHNPLPIDGDFQFFGYSQPIYSLGNFGLGIVNLTSGDVPLIDTNNTTIGSFESRETAYLVSYGNNIGRKFGWGTTLKMAENKIENVSERGYGLDVGSLYDLTPRIRLGAMVRNAIQPKYDFQTESEEFPTILRAGTSVKFLNEHLLTSLDLEKTIGTRQNPRWHFGLEGFIIRNIFLRAGVDENEISTGAGIRLDSIQFDYSAGFQDAGLISRFSIKAFFGGYNVDVLAYPEVFSPVGLKNKVTFRITSNHRKRIVKWIISIRDANNKVVRSFQGHEDPPRRVVWDGRDAQGRIVPPGRYTYRMSITDADNRMETTPGRTIQTVAPTPFEIEAK